MTRKFLVAACLASALTPIGGAAFAKGPPMIPPGWHLRSAVPKLKERQMIAIPAEQPSEMPSLTVQIPEHRLQASAFEKAHIRSFGFEAGGVDALIETTRIRSERIEGLSSFALPRYARIETRFALQTDISPRDTLAVIGGFSRERRRTAVLLAQHNHINNNDLSLSLGWSHDDRLQMSVGMFDIRPTRQSSGTERLIAIASGAPRPASGVAISFNFAPIRNRDALSLGFDLRRQKAEWGQSTGSGRVGESVGAISARLKF